MASNTINAYSWSAIIRCSFSFVLYHFFLYPPFPPMPSLLLLLLSACMSIVVAMPFHSTPHLRKRCGETLTATSEPTELSSTLTYVLFPGNTRNVLMRGLSNCEWQLVPTAGSLVKLEFTMLDLICGWVYSMPITPIITAIWLHECFIDSSFQARTILMSPAMVSY